MVSIIGMVFPPRRIAVYEHGCVQYKKRSFIACLARKYFNIEESRHNLAQVYHSLVRNCVEMGMEESIASRKVSYAWNIAYGNKEFTCRNANPFLVENDAFIRDYTRGYQITNVFYEAVVRAVKANFHNRSLQGLPILVRTNNESYHGIGAGMNFLGALSQSSRLYHDNKEGGALDLIQEDLNRIQKITQLADRKLKVMTLLSGAAYRDIDGKAIQIPSLVNNKLSSLVTYRCTVERIWKGVFAFRVVPESGLGFKKERSILVFQGTTAYPSHDGWIAKLLADVHVDGVGSGAFNADREKILKVIKSLKNPYLAGHSLGASMVRHSWHAFPKKINEAYMFSTPGMERKTALAESKLTQHQLGKGKVYCNIDDPVSWEIGTNISTNTRLIIGTNRWKTNPGSWLDFLIIPWIFRMIKNYVARVTSHNTMMHLQKTYLVIPIDAKREGTLRVVRPLFLKLRSWRPFAERCFKRWHNYWEKVEINKLRGSSN